MNIPGILILSAPSGAGKTSLSWALVNERDDVGLTISHTTRPQRPGEVDGRDYHFVDHDHFHRMIHADQFVEYAEVFGNLYGTSIEAIEALTRTGRHALLEIDWQGARKVREQYPGTRSVFINPPSEATLEQRLRDRRQDSDQVIAKRMRQARSEMSHADEYDVIIVNDDFACALEQLNHAINELNEPIPGQSPVKDPAVSHLSAKTPKS